MVRLTMQKQLGRGWPAQQASMGKGTECHRTGCSLRATTRMPASSGKPPSGLGGRVFNPNLELLQALLKQAQRDTLPWVRDLVEPVLLGPPQPLTDTTAPRNLADKDSLFISVNGLSIHCKKRISSPQPEVFDEFAPAAALGGNEEAQQPGTSMLLFHGFNGSVFNWRLVMDDLAAWTTPDLGCRVVAFDRPPFGLSERPRSWPEGQESPYTNAAGVEFGVGLMRALGMSGPAVLVGHSAGAPIAIEFALRYPELVSGLVLIAPAVAADDKGFLARADFGQLLRFFYTRALLSNDWTGLQYIRRQIAKRRQEVVEGRMGIYYDETNVPDEVIQGYLKPLKAHDWDYGSLNVFRAFELAKPPPFAAIRAPVLVLNGDSDTAVPAANARAVAERFRKARSPGCITQYVELPRCGHLPVEEKPREVIDAIVGFVNTHCRPDATRPGSTPDHSSPSSAGAGAHTSSDAQQQVAPAGI